MIKLTEYSHGQGCGCSHSKAMAVFYKIVKWVKNGVLMIIHIYAKVSTSKFKLLLVQGSLD
jgi:hypothetical protein